MDAVLMSPGHYWRRGDTKLSTGATASLGIAAPTGLKIERLALSHVVGMKEAWLLRSELQRWIRVPAHD